MQKNQHVNAGVGAPGVVEEVKMKILLSEIIKQSLGLSFPSKWLLLKTIKSLEVSQQNKYKCLNIFNVPTERNHLPNYYFKSPSALESFKKRSLEYPCAKGEARTHFSSISLNAELRELMD